MSKNTDQIVVAQNGAVWVAEIGADLPTDLGALGPGYTELGYASEDGVTFNYSQTTENVMGWQSKHVLRRIATAAEAGLSMNLLQWNRDSLRTAFGGGDVTEVTPGVYRWDFLDDDDSLYEHVVVVDWQDGGNKFRLVVPKVTSSESSETQLQRTAASQLAVALTALKEDGEQIMYLLSDAEDLFEPAS